MYGPCRRGQTLSVHGLSSGLESSVPQEGVPCTRTPPSSYPLGRRCPTDPVELFSLRRTQSCLTPVDCYSGLLLATQRRASVVRNMLDWFAVVTTGYIFAREHVEFLPDSGSGNPAESITPAAPSRSTWHHLSINSLCLRSRAIHHRSLLRTTVHTLPHSSAFSIKSHGHIHHDSLDLHTRPINQSSLFELIISSIFGTPHLIVLFHFATLHQDIGPLPAPTSTL